MSATATWSTTCGSTPTDHLVADMEALREHLGIDRWLLHGGLVGDNPRAGLRGALPASCVWDPAQRDLDVASAGDRLEPDAKPVTSTPPDADVLAFVRICAHYYAQAAWLDDGAVVRDAGRLAASPACWCTAGLDLSCPVAYARDLVRARPGAELHVDDGSGRRGSAVKRAWTLGALDRFAGS
jgi:hypothetical protein